MQAHSTSSCVDAHLLRFNLSNLNKWNLPIFIDTCILLSILLKSILHIPVCFLIGLVSFVLLTKDALKACAFEENGAYVLVEEDCEFDKIPLSQTLYSIIHPTQYKNSLPVLHIQNTKLSGQTCIELHSPPPELNTNYSI